MGPPPPRKVCRAIRHSAGPRHRGGCSAPSNQRPTLELTTALTTLSTDCNDIAESIVFEILILQKVSERLQIVQCCGMYRAKILVIHPVLHPISPLFPTPVFPRFALVSPRFPPFCPVSLWSVMYWEACCIWVHPGPECVHAHRETWPVREALDPPSCKSS